MIHEKRESRKLLMHMTSTGALLASIDHGYRKHKRTAGERHRRRALRRKQMRVTLCAYGESLKRGV